jgi:hypothetical protein
MKAPCKKLFHFNSLWQEIIFTVVNGLTQNQSKTSKSKADESQILNEVQNLFATGQLHR